MLSRFVGSVWLIIFSMLLTTSIQKGDLFFIIIESLVIISEVFLLTVGKEEKSFKTFSFSLGKDKK